MAIIQISDMPTGTELTSLEMTQKNQQGLTLKVLVQHQVYVVNGTEGDICMQESSVLAGFGKGGFKVDLPEDDKVKSYLFQLSGPNDL
eukprot:5043411-Pyramimonas_sp.AAC.1